MPERTAFIPPTDWESWHVNRRVATYLDAIMRELGLSEITLHARNFIEADGRNIEVIFPVDPYARQIIIRRLAAEGSDG